MRNTLANPFFATRVTHQVESTKMSWVSKDELKPGYDNVWFQMATVGCSPHIDFLQISAVSAAVPWKRRTGKPIDLLITYLLNTYSMIMYRDVYTSYYQWVPPFLIASACLFYLPRWDQPIKQEPLLVHLHIKEHLVESWGWSYELFFDRDTWEVSFTLFLTVLIWWPPDILRTGRRRETRWFPILGNVSATSELSCISEY